MKIFLSCLFLLLFSLQSFAHHIIGGEMYYDYLGNNKYKIYIVVYRDCTSSTPFDDPLPLSIYNSNGNLVQNISVSLPPTTILPINFSNPCINPPQGFCNERAIYTTTVTLPPTPNGYFISYQRCCRRPQINNIQSPGDTGLTLSVHIPGSSNNLYQNSAPRFTNYPPLVLCNNQVLEFDNSATDADGDSLVYDLYPPFSGATSSNPAPNPAPAPPYANIQWANGYSTSNPFGAGATISLDPQTGHLECHPQQTGYFVVGIRVREYRNGVLLTQVVRDFIFQVISCDIQLESIITPQDQLPGFVDYCQGQTVNFGNQSYGGTYYHWDFGVSGTQSDTSNVYSPSFTFPTPGDYTVTLIVNEGMPCSDTSQQVFHVYPHMDANFTHTDSLCFNDNSYDFTATYSGPQPADFSWDFGGNSTNQSTQLTANNVHFSQAGTQNVTFTANFQNLCTKTITEPVVVLPQPQADFSMVSGSECQGLAQNFVNSTANATSYSWDFGDGTPNETQQTPSHTYAQPGIYDVTLIAGAGSQCMDTAQLQITVNPALLVDFTHNDSLCISNALVHFVGNIQGPTNYSIDWDFGNVATPSSSDSINVDVTYHQAGVFPVILTASLTSCSVSDTSSVTIFSEPTIGFTMKDLLYCQPATVQFINQSHADAPLTYAWDLGNGTTSHEQNPTGIYPDPGIYSVSLTVISSVGCIDTLTLSKDSLFRVYPKPTAKFLMQGSEPVTICDNVVKFVNLSSDAKSYKFVFDDTNTISYDFSPTHSFMTSGLKYPYLVATNEFGCSDTMQQQLFVEPVSIYIPNTFTPNGDESNNVFVPVTVFPTAKWDFKIYNKWGELIFETNHMEDYWDGTYKGLPAPIDTYTYVLDVVTCESRKPERRITGHVNLLR